MEIGHRSVTIHCLVKKMKNSANILISYAMEQAKSLAFSLQNRVSPTCFSRSPKLLDFENTTLLILNMNMVKKAIAVEIMHFFRHLSEVPKAPSRQAFSKARDKISYLAFKDFADKSFELAVAGEGAKLYKGYRLWAFDGTSFFVGDSKNKSLRDYFGESTTVAGRAMCRIGGVVDVLNECIVDAAVSGFEVGERALAVGQIKKLGAVGNALFLFDRGYWSPELVSGIVKNGQKFMMRLASNAGNTVIKDEDGETVRFRRYSFTLPSGDTETLLTNLSSEEVPDDELPALYAKRWGVETKYLELKSRLEIDNFSAGSANAVLQDIYATLYISNLTAFLCFEADEIIEEKIRGKGNQYPQKANRAFCIAALRDRFVFLCLIPNPFQRGVQVERFLNELSAQVSYVGKSKSRPRDKRKLKDSRLRTPLKSVL